MVVLEYASKGTVADWDGENKEFVTKDKSELSEEYLRILFRDCIKGLNYSK